ncbi:hypothetical protein D3C80_1355100 [compost metagenome]
MHAVVYIGDGIHRAVEQHLAALLGFPQGHFGGAAGAAFLEVAELAVGHQHQSLVLALRHGVLGAEGERFGDSVRVVTLHQLDEGDVAGLTANAVERLVRGHGAAFRRRDQQVPALLEDLFEVGAGSDAVDAGGASGVAEQADQTFGLVLRVFENQQTDGLLDGHWRAAYTV